MIFKYVKFAIRDFLGLETDYESILTNQGQIIDQLKELKGLEIQNQEMILEGKKISYYDYLTLKNLIWLLLFFGFIGGGFWLYNTDFFNNSTLESIKSLGNLSKDLQLLDHKGVLDALKKLNENSVDLSKEEIKLLLEIKNLLLKKGIEDNPNLDKLVNLEGKFTLGNPIPGIDTNN